MYRNIALSVLCLILLAAPVFGQEVEKKEEVSGWLSCETYWQDQGTNSVGGCDCTLSGIESKEVHDIVVDLSGPQSKGCLSFEGGQVELPGLFQIPILVEEGGVVKVPLPQRLALVHLAPGRSARLVRVE